MKNIKLFIILVLVQVSVFAQNRDHAFDVNSKLGQGINLGNMFEGDTDETWGQDWESSWNPDYPEMIANLGFKHVRIPVKWEPENRSNPASPYTIDAEFLNKIKGVVDACLHNGLMAIINMHHHTDLFADPAAQKERFLSHWNQISEFFKDYSDDLVFEIINEPQGSLVSTELNTFIADALTTIREDNPTRIVMISPEWGSVGTLSALDIPSDENIILTMHCYAPMEFTHQGASWVSGSDEWIGTKWNDTETDRQVIINHFAPLKVLEERENIPVHIGEFGAYNIADDDSREKWTTFMSRYIESLGWSGAYWEFSGGFGIYDPNAQTYRPYLVDALLNNPMPEPAPMNIKEVYASDFSVGIDDWRVANSSGAVSSIENANDQMVIDFTNTTGTGWHIQLLRSGLNLEDGKKYRVTFRVRADEERWVTAFAAASVSPWGPYGDYHSFIIGTTMKDYSYTFDMTTSDDNGRIKFDLGNNASDLYFDSIVLEEILESTNTSIKQINDINSTVYPNPSQGFLYVNNQDEFEEMFVANVVGQIVKQVKINRDLNKLSLEDLPTGIYLITLFNQNIKHTYKIIKK